MNSAIWQSFEAATPKLRERARARFVAVRKVRSFVDQGQPLASAYEAAATETGQNVWTVQRAWRAVQGLPYCDWLPALLPNYVPGGRRAEMSDDAWRYFIGRMAEGSDQPAAAAYRDLVKAAKRKGWAVPSLKTLQRRWKHEFGAATKAQLTSGPKAADALFPAMQRSVTSLAALDVVNLDGRKADVFVRWEDGEIGRPVVIALQDVFSRKMLGWVYAKSENADATKRLLLKVMREHGRFRKLRTDNSRAFASRKISGGAPNRFRWKVIEDELTGLLPQLGIDVGFALPANGRAKPIERAFRDLASDIDRRPEFQGAYCGNAPDAKPEDFTGTPVDIALFREIYDEGMASHNERSGRRTEIACGRSFDQVFAESRANQPDRPLLPEQERYFRYETAYLKPTPQGAIRHQDHMWFSPEHQDVLLRYRQVGDGKVRVLFDPDNLSGAVMVEDKDRRLLVAALPCLRKGRFDSTEDARAYGRAKSQYRKAAKRKAEAVRRMSRVELAAIDAEARAARTSTPAPTSNLVEPAFGVGPKRPKATALEPASLRPTPEMEANFRKTLDRMEAYRREHGAPTSRRRLGA
ncbi:transposase domain-containing protein [Tistrella sp.]|nr:transposase domain-containing protein [Tistrella sp.]